MEKFLALIAVSFGKKATVYAIGRVSFSYLVFFFNIITVSQQSTVRLARKINFHRVTWLRSYPEDVKKYV